MYGAHVQLYLRDPTFSRFDTTPECDRQTDRHTHTNRHTTTAYTALGIASRGKNSRQRDEIVSGVGVAFLDGVEAKGVV